MKVYEYLCRKYGVEVPAAMNYWEAVCFGAGWPLKRGWLTRIGDKTITPEIAAKIKEKLDARSAEESEYTKIGLRLLGEIASFAVARQDKSVQDAIELLKSRGYTVRKRVKK